MTKIKIFGFVALATLALAGCKKSAVEPEAALPGLEKEGFIKVQIAAPAQGGVNAPGRIGENGDNYGDFNDGEAFEHTIETAVLVLFKGNPANDESTYTLHSAYELANTSWSMESSNPQVTKTGAIVTKIEQAGLGTNETFFALVLLNKHNYFTVNGTDLYQGSTKLTGSTALTVGNLLLDETHRNFSAQSFFMTNMPYAQVGGGSNKPTGAVTKVLYPVNPESIYASETDAAAGAAVTTVNVERALAKVSVTANATSVTTDLNSYTGTVLGWFIDNTNPTTYVVRHSKEPVDGTYATSALGYLQYASTDHATYRFVAEAPVVPGTNFYRTFWAVDANYDAPAVGLTTEAGKIVDNTIMQYNPDGSLLSGRLRPVGSYYYTTENTFDIKHQSVNNTTRIVVAIQFNGGHDFYTVEPSQETGTIYNEDDVKNEVISQVLNRVTATQWLEEYINGAVVTDATSLFEVTVTPNVDGDGKSVGTAKAEVALKALELAKLKAGKTVADAETAWNTQYSQDWVDTNIKISHYPDGVCYYAALIKHFGDFETPWTESLDMDNTTDGVYGTNSNNFLGRYGIVRNNWYKVNITGVRTLGTSVVPPLTPDVPDDQVEKYIKVEINITPWVIRTQDVKL